MNIQNYGHQRRTTNMIIEDNRKKNATRFKDLDLGDMFMSYNQLYMKTFTVDTYGFGQAWCFDRNCLYTNFTSDTIVQKVNAKIVIYD